MDRQTLSIMKACEVVGVSRRTIYNWISAGKVEYIRTAGGAIRIFADSLWRDPDSQPRQVSGAVRTHRLARVSRGPGSRRSAFAAEPQAEELRLLFHQLNNQLGIILACAELLEIKAADDSSRSRASEVVAKVLDALGTTKQIRQQVESRAA